jgi:hypothetical protein
MSGLLSRPGSKGGVLRAWLSGVVLMLLSFYMLLLSGVFDSTIGRIVGKIVSTDSVRVTIPSIHSDLFWHTRADTVLAEGPRGLLVRVTGGRTSGAIHSFFLSRSVRGIYAEQLEIRIPSPRPGGEPVTLARILEDTDRGIVCSADSLRLDYGFITDSAGTLLDSMCMVSSVSRNDGVSVTAANASCWIRGVGTVSGNGQVSMENGIVTSPGFSGSTPWGNLYFSGRLNGADGAVDILATGSVISDGFGLPFRAGLDFDGHVTGTIGQPSISTSVRNGEARISGLDFEFSADTALASLQGVALRGVRLSGPGAELLLDGMFTFQDLSWEASGLLILTGADPSFFLPGLPSGSLAGSAMVSLSGDSAGLSEGTLNLDLQNSSAGTVHIGSASIDASFRGAVWNASADVSSMGSRAVFSGGGLLDEGYIPSSYRGSLQLQISESEALPAGLLPALPPFAGLEADLQIAGSHGVNSASGEIGLSSMLLSGVEISAASASGSLELSRSGAEGSLTFGIDALRIGGVDLAARGNAGVAGRAWIFDDLSIMAPGGVEVSATGTVVQGDTTLLSLRNLKANQSKLRLVTGGGVEGRFMTGAFLLDTAWVTTPHGLLGLSGRAGPGDSLLVAATIADLDFSSLSSALLIPGGFSGVGDFNLRTATTDAGLDADVAGTIYDPSYGTYSADSITVDLAVRESNLQIGGLYSWQDGSRSGLSGSIESCWSNGGLSLSLQNAASLELEVNRLGDWVFYALPIPARTRGADISAHASFVRAENGQTSFDVEAVAMADRLTLTSLGMPFTDVVLYFTHHSADTAAYNTSIKIASVGRAAYGLLSAELLMNIDSLLVSPSPGTYRFAAGFDGVRTSIGDFAVVNLSGSIYSSGNDPLSTRPEITGKILINEALVGMPAGRSSGGLPASLPFDLNIAVKSNRGVWFRSSLADIELGVDVTILTVNTYPTLGGSLSSLRGKVRLLDRDFEIDEGTIEFISSVPPGTRMSITAKTVVRDVIDNSDYTIWVSIQGTPTNPLITLSGEGPSGTLTQEDILALLAVGLTYGELQQIDSANIRDQLEDAAQGYLGRLLARSLREGIGLDELQLTPELLADSTSLTLNVGKYVLPDLFVSYTGDVFSTEPGTISAQYYFSRDLYVTGSTKSTLHGSQEPSLELHYTFRY